MKDVLLGRSMRTWHNTMFFGHYPMISYFTPYSYIVIFFYIHVPFLQISREHYSRKKKRQEISNSRKGLPCWMKKATWPISNQACSKLLRRKLSLRTRYGNSEQEKSIKRGLSNNCANAINSKMFDCIYVQLMHINNGVVPNTPITPVISMWHLDVWSKWERGH